MLLFKKIYYLKAKVQFFNWIRRLMNMKETKINVYIDRIFFILDK